MNQDERLHLIQKVLDELRNATNLDSIILVTREQLGVHENSLMLFSSGVDTTTTGRDMLEAGLTFFPDADDIMAPESDGRQRLQ
jgi:hypothetical protein